MTATTGTPVTPAVPAGEDTVWAAISAVAAATPDATAVVDGEHQLSYRELVEQAGALAGCLPAGEPDRLTAVSLPRSADLVVAMLAAMSVGGYLPLDPDAPESYLDGVVAGARPAAVLTRAGTRPPRGVPQLDVHAAGTGAGTRRREIHPGETAYVLYTSGSTGRPKGVVVEHGDLLAHVRDFGARLRLRSADRYLLFAPVHTDVSVEQVLTPLVHGAALVVCPPGLAEDPESFLDFCVDNGLTVLNLPAGYWRLLTGHPGIHELSRLRWMIVGSDVMPAEQARIWLGAGTGGLLNAYGPTEAIITAGTQDVGPRTLRAGGASVPLGSPLPGRELRVLDARLAPVAPGEVGELYLAGRLARGYLGDPARTAAAFLPDPDRPGGRMYRTGDLAALDPDGVPVFAGRVDRQVKIRGFRVEPASVEAAARALPGVADCAAVPVRRGERTSLHLLVVPAPAGGQGDVLERLRAELPEHAVPSRVVVVDALPLTGAGKVDAEAAAVLSVAGGDTEEPADELTEGLLRAWRSAFGTDSVGLDDDFVRLGGDSMTSLAIACQAPALGVRIRPRDVFEARTVRALATRLGAGGDDRAGAPEPTEREVTPAVHWLLDRLGELPRTWNQYVLLRVAQDVDPVLVRQALVAVVARHPVLSTPVRGTTAGDPAGHEPSWSVERVDSDRPLVKLLDNAQLAVDPADGRMIHAAWITEAAAPSRLLLVAHHAAVDAVSWQLLLYDLDNTYRMLRDAWGLPSAGRPPTARHWAGLLRAAAAQGRFDGEVGYWSAVGTAAASLPVADEPGTEANARTVTVEAELPAEADPATRLLTAALLAWGAHTGRQACLVELEGTGRTSAADSAELDDTVAEQAVGWLTALYPAVLPTGPDRATVARGVAAHAGRLPRGGLGHGVLRHLHPDAAVRAAMRVPRPDLAVNFLGRTPVPAGSALVTGVEAGSRRDGAATRPCPVLVEGSLDGDRMTVTVEVDGSVVGEQRAAELAATLRAELSGHAEFGLTPAQEGILFHAVLDRAGAGYVGQLAVEITGEVSTPDFIAAWQEVARSTPPLRTSFRWRSRPEPVQLVGRALPVPVTVHDWRAGGTADDLLRAERAVPFDLEQAPLFRVALARLPGGRHACVLTHHHLILDGWSMNLLLADFAETYQRIRAGEQAAPAPRPSVERVVARGRDEDGDFWRDLLGGGLPTPVPGTGPPRRRGGTHEETAREIGPGDWAELTAAARGKGLTPAAFVHLAWALVLAGAAGTDEATFGTVLSGRDEQVPRIGEISGMLINTLPVRFTLPPGDTVGQWAAGAMRTLLAVGVRQRSSLVDARRAAGLGPRDVLFDHVLDVGSDTTMLGTIEERTVAGLRVRPLGSVERTNYGVTVTAHVAGALELSVNHDTGLLTPAEAEGVLDRLAVALRALATSGPDTKLGDLRTALTEGVPPCG